jgi:uncharacterized protein YgbK (DUF1537 family)
MALRLGCIADDFTGATDLANNLVRAGMSVVQTVGVPETGVDPQAQAVVVSLKSRSIAPEQAVAESLAAARWLRGHGAQQLYFKYCSTFDSTPEGNIGPVTDALMDLLGCDFTIACPAFPDSGRTVFKGYLFAGDVPLNESGMRHHPVTPMTDANLMRVLQAQTRRKVGLIDYTVVARGAAAVRERIQGLKQEGVAIAIADAISNADLLALGAAVGDLPLVTAGSGLALGLPANWGVAPSADAARLGPAQGRAAILAGSCSAATNAQVHHFEQAGGGALALDPRELAAGADLLARAVQWYAAQDPGRPALIYTTDTPDGARRVQQGPGAADIGARIEKLLAAIARELVVAGTGRLVVAGGETSGAVVQALGIQQLRIGPQIDPGVPWCCARVPEVSRDIHIALKSGNFGAMDFFSKAFAMLD